MDTLSWGMLKIHNLPGPVTYAMEPACLITCGELTPLGGLRFMSLLRKFLHTGFIIYPYNLRPTIVLPSNSG